MNNGIEDVNNLAWKIASALSGGSTSILNSYETERLYAVIHAAERTSDIASNTLYFAPFLVLATIHGLLGPTNESVWANDRAAGLVTFVEAAPIFRSAPFRSHVTKDAFSALNSDGMPGRPTLTKVEMPVG